MSTLKNRFKQLGKDSVVYGLSGVIARGLGFFLLPLYTRVFTPNDYGTIETMNLLSSFLGALLVMGMDSAQSFYFFEQKENGKEAQRRLISGVLQWRLSWGMVFVVLALLISPILNSLLFNGELSWKYFALGFMSTFLTQISLQSAEIHRLLYRPWFYIAITVTNTLATIIFTILFVVILRWGVWGYFIGNVTGSLLAMLVGWWSIWDYLDWSKWHNDWWPRLLRFGMPLVPAGLSMYFLNTIDRWAVSQLNSTELLGLYSVAEKFVTLFTLVVTSFRQAWWPIAMDALNSSDGPPLFRMMGRIYMGLGTIAIIVLTAVSPWLIRLLTTPLYYSAYTVVGILAWQPLFFGLYLIVSGGVWKREKTNWTPIGMAVAIALNLVFVLLLVPRYELIGAATATGLAYLGWNVFTLIISERLWPVQYPVGIFVLQIGIGILAMIGILLLYDHDMGIAGIGQVSLLTILSSGLILAITIKRSQIQWVLGLIKQRQVSLMGGK